MYYNPETRQTMMKQMLQNHINASFPDGTDEILGWHLVDEEAKRPALEEGQKAVKSEIILEDGKYFQTYAVEENEAIQNVQSNAMQDSSRIATLERAVVELAQMMSNFEDYRAYREETERTSSRMAEPDIVPKETPSEE